MSENSIVKAELKDLGNGKYMLEDDLIVRVPEIAAEFRVPMGFPTDLTSIPPFFGILWWLVGHPATSEFKDAAIVHDWFCVRATNEGNRSLRVLGDAVFRYLLRANGVKFRKRVLMYYAVRVNGWIEFTRLKAFSVFIKPMLVALAMCSALPAQVAKVKVDDGIASSVAIGVREGESYFLTAAHVFRVNGKMRRSGKVRIKGKWIPVTLVDHVYSETEDIACFKADGELFSDEETGRITDNFNGKVSIVGFRLNSKTAVSRTGVVSKLSSGTVDSQSGVDPGDSGGPVYNDNYEIVGIVSGHKENVNSEVVVTTKLCRFIRRLPFNFCIGKPDLFVWSAPWCPNCVKFKKAWDTDPVFKCAIKSKYKVTIFNTDIHKRHAAANRITSIPAFQTPHKTVVNFTTKEKLLTELGINCNCEVAPPPPKEVVSGPKGEAGRPPTASEIAAAVSEYLRLNPPKDGRDGSVGPRGPAGKDGSDTDLTSILKRLDTLEQRKRVVVIGGNGKILDRDSYGNDEPIVLDIQRIVNKLD